MHKNQNCKCFFRENYKYYETTIHEIAIHIKTSYIMTTHELTGCKYKSSRFPYHVSIIYICSIF